MNNLKILKKVEQIEIVHQMAKQAAISLGANESQFTEIDEKIGEIKERVLSKLRGGIISKSSGEGGEYIINRSKI